MRIIGKTEIKEIKQDKTPLKPCPFCGCDVKIDNIYADESESYFMVSCQGCDAGVSFGFKSETKAGAIKAWNRRAAELDVSKQVINNSYDVYFCPTCHKAVWQNKDESNYCFRCGQKLLWCVHDNPKLLEVEKCEQQN